VLPPYTPDLARPESHEPELSNWPFAEDRSANAPAAMYFVISVLPISITSGPPPPASVASNFWRWSPQVWYCTFTVVPGWSDWNFLLTDATRSAQPDCASICSHMVMLEAFAFFVAPDVVAATAAATRATSKRAAILRLFIWKPPVRSVGTDHFP